MAKKRDTILLHLCLEHPKPSSHKQVWSHKCTSASFLLIFGTTLLLSVCASACLAVFLFNLWKCTTYCLLLSNFCIFFYVRASSDQLCSSVHPFNCSTVQLFNCSTLSPNLPLKKKTNVRACAHHQQKKKKHARAHSIRCSLKSLCRHLVACSSPSKFPICWLGGVRYVSNKPIFNLLWPLPLLRPPRDSSCFKAPSEMEETKSPYPLPPHPR